VLVAEAKYVTEFVPQLAHRVEPEVVGEVRGVDKYAPAVRGIGGEERRGDELPTRVDVPDHEHQARVDVGRGGRRVGVLVVLGEVPKRDAAGPLPRRRRRGHGLTHRLVGFLRREAAAVDGVAEDLARRPPDNAAPAEMPTRAGDGSRGVRAIGEMTPPSSRDACWSAYRDSSSSS
jgi:hypothetical protein